MNISSYNAIVVYYPVCLFTLAPVSLNLILSNTGDIQSKHIV